MQVYITEVLKFVRQSHSSANVKNAQFLMPFALLQLEEQLKEKDEEKSELNEKIDEFKQQLSKAEDDTDRVGKY